VSPDGPRYQGVLLDWRGIVVHDPPLSWWVERALEAAGRRADDEVVEGLLSGMHQVETSPGFKEADVRVDTSAETHRSIVMGWLADAGFDDELAEVMYRLDFDPDCHQMYPDVPEVLAAIRARGCRLALVSDFHYDLRPELEARGVAQYFDAFVISYEHGFQKPDRRMFLTALEALGIGPREALMVGDRATHDAGAVAVGVDTLLLPAPAEFGPRGLDVIVRLVG
jgi:HAD superfamily hydrolase (TIGR01509 family)